MLAPQKQERIQTFLNEIQRLNTKSYVKYGEYTLINNAIEFETDADVLTAIAKSATNAKDTVCYNVLLQIAKNARVNTNTLNTIMEHVELREGSFGGHPLGTLLEAVASNQHADRSILNKIVNTEELFDMDSDANELAIVAVINNPLADHSIFDEILQHKHVCVNRIPIAMAKRATNTETLNAIVQLKWFNVTTCMSVINNIHVNRDTFGQIIERIIQDKDSLKNNKELNHNLIAAIISHNYADDAIFDMLNKDITKEQLTALKLNLLAADTNDDETKAIMARLDAARKIITADSAEADANYKKFRQVCEVMEVPCDNIIDFGIISEVVQVTSIDKEDNNKEYVKYHDRGSFRQWKQVSLNNHHSLVDPVTIKPVKGEAVLRPDLTAKLNEIVLKFAENPNYYDDILPQQQQQAEPKPGLS